jgi:large subunit ribosomal protein L15
MGAAFAVFFQPCYWYWPHALQQAGLTNGTYDSVKVLGRGELTQKLTVRANAFSETARAAIEKLGGTAEVVS